MCRAKAVGPRLPVASGVLKLLILFDSNLLGSGHARVSFDECDGEQSRGVSVEVLDGSWSAMAAMPCRLRNKTTPLAFSTANVVRYLDV